jgi:Flp pilus assembly protein TadB
MWEKIFRRRARGTVRRTSRPQKTHMHPGITMHSVPVAGGIGMVFAAGYVVMFWFGAPGFRPIVLAAALLGVLLGAILIRSRSRSRSDRADPSMLHLGRQGEAAGVKNDRAGDHGGPEAAPCVSAVQATAGA